MKKFCSVLLTIAAILSAWFLCIYFSITQLLQKDTIHKIIEKVEIKEVLTLKPEGYQKSPLDSINQFAEKFDIEEEKVEEILDSDIVKENLQEFTGKVLDYTYSQDLKDLYTEEEIKEKTKDLLQNINQDYQLNLKEEDLSAIQTDIEPIYQNINQTAKEMTIESTNSNPLLEMVQGLTNSSPTAILILILIVSLILIGILNFKKGKCFTYYTSFCVAVAIQSFLFGICFVVASSLFQTTFTSASLWNLICGTIYQYAFCITLIMIILGILSHMAKKCCQKEKKKVQDAIS